MSSTVEIIERAFSNVAKPVNARSLAPHECPECEELAADLLPYCFREVPGELVEAHFGDLPLLGPLGFHYYLPAFLAYALENPDSNVLEFAVIHLTPSKRSVNATPEYFSNRFGLFDSAQKAAIAAFFAEVRDHNLYVAHEGELDRAAELWPDAVQPFAASDGFADR
jgi:hypothetical protein